MGGDRRSGQVAEEHGGVLRRLPGGGQTLLDMTLQGRAEPHAAVALGVVDHGQIPVELVSSERDFVHRARIMVGEQPVDGSVDPGKVFGHAPSIAAEFGSHRGRSPSTTLMSRREGRERAATEGPLT